MNPRKTWTIIFQNYGLDDENIPYYVDEVMANYENKDKSLKKFFEDELHLEFYKLVAALLITKRQVDEKSSEKAE